MSTTTGKINLSIHEIQTELEIEGIINVESKNKIDKHLEQIIDHVQNLDEELTGVNEELAEYEQNNNSSYRERAEELETELYELEKKLKKQLPANTLDDENKNKIFTDIHHNLTLEQVEEVERFAKGLIPSNILWKEKL